MLSRTLILLILALSSAANVSADYYSMELTPIYGTRGGGEFVDYVANKKHNIKLSDSYGLIISLPYEYGKTLELYYSHQSSRISSVDIETEGSAAPTTEDIPLSITYLHIGGTAPITDEKRYKTFITGGLGLTYLSPDFSSMQSDLRASFSIGVGMKWPVTNNVAIRLETRGLATLFNSNAALFCDRGCSLGVNGSLLFQAEIFAGLAFRF